MGKQKIGDTDKIKIIKEVIAMFGDRLEPQLNIEACKRGFIGSFYPFKDLCEQDIKTAFYVVFQAMNTALLFRRVNKIKNEGRKLERSEEIEADLVILTKAQKVLDKYHVPNINCTIDIVKKELTSFKNMDFRGNVSKYQKIYKSNPITITAQDIDNPERQIEVTVTPQRWFAVHPFALYSFFDDSHNASIQNAIYLARKALDPLIPKLYYVDRLKNAIKTTLSID